MKKKKSLYILVLLFCFLLILSTKVYADDERTIISEIVGESSDIDSIPVYGGTLSQPSIDVITGYPAYFYTTKGYWQRKNGNSWENVNKNEVFRAGIWRYTCNIYIDIDPLDSSQLVGETHRLNDNIIISVNGKKWTSDKSIININNSYARVYSIEYEIQEPENLIVYDSDELDIGTNKATIPIQEFSISNCVEGGIKPYTYSKKSGPNWINVSSDGRVSGTPTTAGENEDLVIQIFDSSEETQIKTLTISIANTDIDPNLRETITEIVATSNNIDTIPKYDSKLSKPQIITNNENVYFYTSDVIWQKREINSQQWSDYQPPENFSVGIWRYSCTIHVENNELYSMTAGNTYKLSDKTKVKVNGEEWIVNDVQIGIDYSRARVYSKEYYITKPGTYMVAFNTNGGSFIENQIVQNGSKIVKPNNPSKQGYVFEGWYLDKELKNKFDFNISSIISHTTLYAKWHKHNLVYIAAKQPTCKLAGNISYFKCTTCNKLFKDKNGTQEIQLQSTVLPIIAHKLEDIIISTEKTKATFKKNGNIIKNIKIKCSSCGEILGTKTITEKIYKVKKIKLSQKSFVYINKKQIPNIIVKDSNGKIIDESNYTLKYSNKKSKKVGEYTVKINFKNRYKGTKELKYTIKPEGTSIKKIKSGSKQFKLTWNKNTKQTTGYQIQFATNSKFTKNIEEELIENSKKISLKIKGLKPKKKYFVRIRTYKIVNGKIFYSSWSETKTIKTKK